MSTRLNHLHVLLTRPREQAAPLCARLEMLGARVSVFPVFRIERVAPNPGRIALLARADWAVFASANAVHHLRTRANSMPALPKRIAAIGPATAAALGHAGAAPTLVADAPHTSEALLAMAPIATLRGRVVALVRGCGGRTLLAEALARQGNTVLTLNVYRRAPPEQPLALDALAHGTPDRICIASAETAACLLAHTHAPDRAQLLRCRIIAGGARIAAHCRMLGFRAVSAAAAPTDNAMVEALSACAA